MRYAYDQFKQRLPRMDWDIETLAIKLSLIGHETETDGDQLEITLTSNRKDCKDEAYLIFDLAGVYGLDMINPPTNFGHGPEIAVTAKRVNQLLGSNIDQLKLKDLERLGFMVTETGVRPPDFRDVSTDADVAEEVFRLIGSSSLEIAPLAKQTTPESTRFRQLQNIKTALAASGWTETATYSFSHQGLVELKNPFRAEEPFLRASLEAGLLQTLAKNPFMKRSMFFELGNIFTPDETTVVGLMCSGYKDSEAVSKQLSETLGVTIELKPVEPEMAARSDAKQGSILFAQVELAALNPAPTNQPMDNQQLPTFRPISKYPPLVRDISLISSDDQQKNTEELLGDYQASFPELLFIEQIDEYHDQAASRTTRTFRLFLQNLDHTFTEEEIKTLDERITNHFFQKQ